MQQTYKIPKASETLYEIWWKRDGVQLLQNEKLQNENK